MTFGQFIAILRTLKPDPVPAAICGGMASPR